MNWLEQVFGKAVAKRLNEYALQLLPNRGGDPDRPKILELNRQMRKLDHVGGVPEDWGYVALNIPEPDMRVLQLRYPDLKSLDYQIQFKAWQKFLRSPESEPYKLRRNDGKTLAQIRRSG